ncbi:MAG: transposase [Phocaeicola sp.]
MSHEILNFFNNRATNASAECFNAKLKKLRVDLRGVNDVPFFLLLEQASHYYSPLVASTATIATLSLT